MPKNVLILSATAAGCCKNENEIGKLKDAKFFCECGFGVLRRHSQGAARVLSNGQNVYRYSVPKLSAGHQCRTYIAFQYTADQN